MTWYNSNEELFIEDEICKGSAIFKGYAAKFEKDYRVNVRDSNKRFKRYWKVRTEIIFGNTVHRFYGDPFEFYALKSSAYERLVSIMDEIKILGDSP